MLIRHEHHVTMTNLFIGRIDKRIKQYEGLNLIFQVPAMFQVSNLDHVLQMNLSVQNVYRK